MHANHFPGTRKMVCSCYTNKLQGVIMIITPVEIDGISHYGYPFVFVMDTKSISPLERREATNYNQFGYGWWQTQKGWHSPLPVVSILPPPHDRGQLGCATGSNCRLLFVSILPPPHGRGNEPALPSTSVIERRSIYLTYPLSVQSSLTVPPLPYPKLWSGMPPYDRTMVIGRILSLSYKPPQIR